MVIVCRGPQAQVTLNDERIIDANLIDYMRLEKSHPGLKRRRGYIGLQNHSTRVDYRNIRITEMEEGAGCFSRRDLPEGSLSGTFG